MESITTYKALVSVKGVPTIVDVEPRELNQNELFIKVHSSPINPSDQFRIMGSYQSSPEVTSWGVGFEGAGEVIDAHENAKEYIGKTVAFFQTPAFPSFQGTWRQYLYSDKESVLVFPDGSDYDVLASNFVNPLTVWGFVDIFQKNGHKAIIQNAACSSLGKMMVKLCKKLEIPLINLVRREEQVETLSQIGAEYIVNTSTDTYLEELKELIKKLKVDLFLDPVSSGPVVENVIQILPTNSTVYFFGGLSRELLQINVRNTFVTSDLIFRGFLLMRWAVTLTKEEREKWNQLVIDDLKEPEENSIFKSKIVKTVPLEGVVEALPETLKVASEGKIIIRPHDS